MPDPIAYSTVAKDGTLRMALHPMDCAPPYWGESAPPSKRFPFRVVFWRPEGSLAWLLEGEDD